MVGLGRFELPTSRLSGVRSNQLSYRPDHAPPSPFRRKTERSARMPRWTCGRTWKEKRRRRLSAILAIGENQSLYWILSA